ncbi:MAG: tetratricopeptide repeat protein, partial [Bryobacteraceae bacterium]
VLVLILFGAACLTKEHTVVLPALLLLTDYFWNPGFSVEGMRRNWKLYIPVFAGAAVGGYFVWTVLRQATSAGFGVKEFTWYEYLFTQFRAIWVYLRLYLLPVNLNADYDYPISQTILQHGSIFGLIGLLALCYLAWRYRRGFKLASYGFFGFLLLLAPTSSFVPIRDAIAERRVYLPFVCLLLITVDLLRRLRINRTALTGGLTALLILAGVLTYQRNHVWAGPIPLWQDTVKKSPHNARAHFQLGFAYFEKGRCQEALKHYETAAGLDTPDDRLLLDWALAYDCLNMPKEAVAKLNQAALVKPSAQVYATIGMVHAKRNNAAEALPPLEKAEQMDPGFDMTYLYRGHVYLGMKEYGKAAAEYRRALSINPSNVYASKALAVAEAKLKNPSP